MRAKFTVQSVEKFGYGGEKAKLTCVYSGTPEDNEFAKATPSGLIEIHIDNPAAQNFLIPGKNFYVDFTPAS